jgi:hypothetical protein
MTTRDVWLQNIIKAIALDEHVPFIPITQDTHPVFRDYRLYKDVLHLNDKGSVIFSKIVCLELKKLKNESTMNESTMNESTMIRSSRTKRRMEARGT